MAENQEEEVSLVNLGGGAAVEMFDHELRRALMDLKDPNTDSKKPREVLLKVRIFPSDSQLKAVEISCDAKLGKNRNFDTHFMVGQDAVGRLIVNEYLPRQMGMFDGEGKGKITSISEGRK